MTREDLIKQAYAYGASVALTEAGFDKYAADQLAIQLLQQKLAEGDDEPMGTGAHAGIGTGAGIGLGAGGAALATYLLSRGKESPQSLLKMITDRPAVGKAISGGNLKRFVEGKGAVTPLMASLKARGARGLRDLGARSAENPYLTNALMGGAGGAALGAGGGALTGAIRNRDQE